MTALNAVRLLSPRHLESQLTACVLAGLGGASFLESVSLLKDGDISKCLPVIRYRVPPV